MRDKRLLWQGLLWLAIAVSVLVGCQPVQRAELPPEDTLVPPTATQTPTPTTVWFPATATPTPRPTLAQTPTPDSLRGVGDLLYEDDFSDSSLWTRYETANGKVTIANDHITLAHTEAEGLIYGFRTEPQMTDFYAELNARPNFCQEDAEYGLMVRVNGTRLNHYRFVISCDGQASVLRVVNNRGNVIVDWQAHPLIPTTFPVTVRLGVWAQGTELRFYLNNFLLFTATDTIIDGGTLGVFVRAAGNSPVSVNFDTLEVYQLGATQQ